MDALIYISSSKVKFSTSNFIELEFFSSKTNRKMDITGFLSYHNNYFYQYLEGDSRLNILMEKINNDIRHNVVKVLYFNDLNNRIFPDWNMKIFHKDQMLSDEDLLIRSLFLFVKNNKPNNKYLKLSFIQNLKLIQKSTSLHI